MATDPAGRICSSLLPWDPMGAYCSLSPQFPPAEPPLPPQSTERSRPNQSTRGTTFELELLTQVKTKRPAIHNRLKTG